MPDRFFESMQMKRSGRFKAHDLLGDVTCARRPSLYFQREGYVMTQCVQA